MEEPEPDSYDVWDPEPVRWYNQGGKMERIATILVLPFVFMMMAWALLLTLLVDLVRYLRGKETAFLGRRHGG